MPKDQLVRKEIGSGNKWWVTSHRNGLHFLIVIHCCSMVNRGKSWINLLLPRSKLDRKFAPAAADIQSLLQVKTVGTTGRNYVIIIEANR
ncbi:hypothetical protein J1N35_023431 [Gossypium stocksii]|uniref:Uncharacterized protein n=1 Tax=Gossypium stocksii TaxID=47602 RepID=A0A9D3VI31_9ROSI|nr:hypothetical protein J1N35_023431 [Gossypium stocksii]